ncbi:PhoH family protein [Deferrisoma camini]|uniref:PhoH family protein n=1 Tax=Deferrisoma camini TaxID=1035120 RepID=UPI00046D0372|nr:PhoH family protein [Deferrisoma camini]
MSEAIQRVVLDDPRHVQALVGEREAHLRELAHVVRDISVSCRGNVVLVRGDPVGVELAAAVVEQLYELVEEGYPLFRADIDHAVRILRANRRARLKDIFLDAVYIAADRRVISPKSLAQKEYIEAIRTHDIVFGIGPAGTGKTYLAMAMAISAHAKRQVKRIILTRPAVEAGEKLGFLPGTLYEKVNPYLRPLYDALHDMMDFEKASALIERGSIEVAPLAFMRGRTLNDSFVILDEAQNTTSEQMRMFLTRLGFDSKAVITGDVTQVDLPPGTVSGLVEAEGLLAHIPGIRFCRFTRDDVVRHPLVQEIIEAYEARDREAGAENPP